MSSPGLGFRMHAERTPNPNSIKWVLGEPIAPAGTAASFPEPVGEDVSPLAARLFAVRGVTGVFIASSFVTVSKRDDAEWMELAEPLVETIKAFAASGDEALGPAHQSEAATSEGDVVARIRRVLEEEVRPAVAMDGGDVVFAGFRDGVVEVHLQGSCAGCPSSTATLRFGIEQRLREEIPEVAKVVSV
jgi:Fe-S cluster biogenesis protein NfuA